jgi:hypothetical protein
MAEAVIRGDAIDVKEWGDEYLFYVSHAIVETMAK